MINKDFLNNLYNGVDELPAYNYYKADEDIKFLLKDKTININAVQEIRLHELHNEYREWVAKQLFKEKYNNHLLDNAKKIQLNNRIAKLSLIIEILKIRKGNYTLIEEAFTSEEITRLHSQLQECMIPIIPTFDLLLSTCERGVKGVTSELGMMAKEQQKEVNFNYISEVAQVSRYLKMPLKPMDLTLSEWISYNKIIQEDAK